MNPPERTSWLAVFSFGASVAAAGLVGAAWLAVKYAEFAAFTFTHQVSERVQLGGRVAAGVGIVAAVAAVAFCIAARSAVVESRGRIGGRGFYHVGGILSAVAGIIAATLL